MERSYKSHTSLLAQQWGRLNNWLYDGAGNVVLNGQGLEIPDIVFVSRFVQSTISLDKILIDNLLLGMLAVSRSIQLPIRLH